MQSGGFAGFSALDDTLHKAVLSVDSSFLPLDADAVPTYRVYGPGGFMLSGSATVKDQGSVSGASNASPTAITSAGHGLTTGMKINLLGILGNTGANGTYTVTVTDSNHFTIAVDTISGSVYAGGGTWHVIGVYDVAITPTDGANFSPGEVYSVVVHANYSSVLKLIDEFTFQVI